MCMGPALGSSGPGTSLAPMAFVDHEFVPFPIRIAPCKFERKPHWQPLACWHCNWTMLLLCSGWWDGVRIIRKMGTRRTRTLSEFALGDDVVFDVHVRVLVENPSPRDAGQERAIHIAGNELEKLTLT